MSKNSGYILVASDYTNFLSKADPTGHRVVKYLLIVTENNINTILE